MRVSGRVIRQIVGAGGSRARSPAVGEVVVEGLGEAAILRDPVAVREQLDAGVGLRWIDGATLPSAWRSACAG